MSIDVKWVLLLAIAISAITYYAGFVAPRGLLSFKAKAAFLMSTFGLIPICLIMFWYQFTALDRLSKTGVVPYPAIVKAELPFSFNGEQSFTFILGASNGLTPYGFYQDDANRPGWSMVNNNPEMLIFRKEHIELVITADNDGHRSSRSIYYVFHKVNN